MSVRGERPNSSLEMTAKLPKQAESMWPQIYFFVFGATVRLKSVMRDNEDDQKLEDLL